MPRILILLFLLLANFLFSPAIWAESSATRLAVLDFHLSGNGIENRDLGRVMAEMMITRLVKDGRLEIVERGALEKILDEQALELSAVVDDNEAVRAGRLLGVDAIITGTVVRFASYWEVNARCIQTETASILAAESVRASTRTGFRKAAGELALRLVENALPALVVQESGSDQGKPISRKVFGLVGSEKTMIFKDPRARDVLQKGGLSVSIDWSGSRQMATEDNLGKYDFVFPSGIQNARQISRSLGISDYHVAFFTPMVIASWEPIAAVLAANDLVRKEEGIHFLDMAGFLELIRKEKKWSDLKRNSAYPVDRDILITSTDLRTSNSAAMYLAIASYLENGKQMVASAEEVKEVVPLMRRLFLAQGSQSVSSRGPFEDYLLMGMGRSPLVMIYESQFVEAAVNGDLTDDMVMLYPEPTVYVKEVIVPLTEAGDRVGQFVKENDEFGRIALEHGMHTRNTSSFSGHFKPMGLNLPDSLIDVINPPEYGILERMIDLVYE